MLRHGLRVAGHCYGMLGHSTSLNQSVEPEMKDEHDQGYVSPVLYHMVGHGRPDNHEENFRILCDVLTSSTLRCSAVKGLRGCRTEIDYARVLTDGEPIVQSVVCVADIPFGDLRGVHASKYGSFGVGVDKALFARRGGRPVVYVPFDKGAGAGINNFMAKRMLNAHEALGRYFHEDDEILEKVRVVEDFPDSPEDAVDEARTIIGRDVLAFIKYFDFSLPYGDPKNFYMEREWRKFDSFGLEDTLRQVVVPPDYVERVRNAFPNLEAEVVPLDR